MAIERTYNVPLRKEWLKAPMYRRAKKAGKALKEFLARHMKVDIDNVKIGRYANLKVWERGIRNPPHHIKVNVTKDDEGIVRAEIVGAPVEKGSDKKEKPKKDIDEREKKKEEIKKKLEELKKKKEEPKEEKKEEAKETPKAQPRPEVKEEKKAEVNETPKSQKPEVKEEKKAEEKASEEPKKE